MKLFLEIAANDLAINQHELQTVQTNYDDLLNKTELSWNDNEALLQCFSIADSSLTVEL